MKALLFMGKSTVTVCTFALFLFFAAYVCRGEKSDFSDIKHKNILLFHSYSSDYDWTRNINEGAMSILGRLDWSNSVRVEYMDTKNNIGESYYEALIQLLEQKYKGKRFDGIIATDNNAMNFLGRYHEKLFPGAPIVATGINGVGSIDIPEAITAVIAEEANHTATLTQAVRLLPRAKNCFIVVDTTATGRAILAEIKKIIPTLDVALDFHVIDQLNFDELMKFSASRSPDDFIYLLPYFRDKDGATFDQGHVATSMAKVATVPVFVSWDFQMNTGALGGSVVSGTRLGESAVVELLKQLRGQKIDKISQLERDITVNLYDYQVRNRFGIDEQLFPAKTLFINKPVSLLVRHKAVLIPGAAIFAGLLIFLVLILINLKNQRVINRHSRKIIELDKEVIETQRELVSTLGEVIETRSQETGNHVKRVAKISRLIGEKAGLSLEEAELLEAASPLHDVGKIGIPDAILNRPGKLSDKEFLEMQQHTTIGKDILKYSDRRLLTSACSIAYQHHERWDGTGYPEGLRGEEIHVFARITTLADVYDALSMSRCYKSAWPEEKVLNYIQKESGRLFDPNLVTIFFEQLDDLRTIRISLDDHLPGSA